MKIVKVVVEFPTPDHVLVDDVKEFVRDAVASHGGSLDPAEPLFGAGKMVDVKSFTRVKASAEKLSLEELFDADKVVAGRVARG